MSQTSNSNIITRNYLDSLLIETRYMNSTNPDTSFTLYGKTFSSPVMTAALSHLEQLGSGGMARGIAQGAKDAGCVFWYGAAEEDESEMLAGTSVWLLLPKSMRAMCGMTRPTQPMVPQMQTAAAVQSVAPPITTH